MTEDATDRRPPARTTRSSVLVENKPGVLARVAGLFARRGYNIYSLAVAPTDDERFSRITIVVDVESAPLEQIIKQLDKLINVVKITELDPRDVGRARAACSPPSTATADDRGQVIELVRIFEGRILDVGHDALTLSLDGPPDQARRLRGAAAALRHRRAPAHRPGRAAQARRETARRLHSPSRCTSPRQRQESG